VTDEFRHYRRWFYAAAIYNAVWGSAVVLFPGTLLRIVNMNASGALPLVQVIGMMVGVYAYGYYLARPRTQALQRPHLDRSGRQDLRPAGIRLQRVKRGASLELRLDLRVQRCHLVASLLAIRARARPRARDSIQVVSSADAERTL
jgi:hypothetical protein